MEVIPQILFYIVGTYVTFSDLMHLSLTSKLMNKKTSEARTLLAKREVIRLFSSDLHCFRMIIHSISYELGPQDFSTPTLSDGNNWLEILKEGLQIKQCWPEKLKSKMETISVVLQNPENTLPSFHRNSFSKLETTMQENLFEILNKCHSKMNTFSPFLEFEFGKFNNLESIYVLNTNYYLHNSNAFENTPKISMMAQLHYSLVSLVKYYWKIHRISILGRLGITINKSKDNLNWLNGISGETEKNMVNVNEHHRPTIYRNGSTTISNQSSYSNATKYGEFLYEYSVRWAAFSNSIWKLSSMLSNFEQSFNESYTESWPETSFKFTIFRMMTRIWSEEVLTKEMMGYLKEMFTFWIQEYHKDMIQHIRDKTVLKDNSSMQVVLKKFFQALVDLSINEKTVHYMNCSDVELDKLYKTFETILLQETSSFIKNALEVGYKANNLKLVYSVFENHSTTVKGFLFHRSQRLFDKTRTEVIVKFVRFLICSRLKQFESFDASKIEGKWNPTYENVMNTIFEGKDSVFLKNFNKAAEEKNIDKSQFKKYWMITMGKDWALIKKMYDNTLLSYDKILKAFNDKDAKVKAHKISIGIEQPTTKEEIKLISLMNRANKKYIDKILFEYFGSFNRRDLRSFSTTEQPCCEKDRFDFYEWKSDDKNDYNENENEEDKETQDCSESTNDACTGSDFSRVFKNGQHWLEIRTKSMKKNELIIPLKPSFLARRGSM